MTIIYADGFDSYNDNDDLQLRWTLSETSVGDHTYGNVGRNGVGRRFTFQNSFSSITRGLFDQKTVVYFGFAYRNSDLGLGGSFDDLFSLIENGTTQCALARPASSGQLGFYRVQAGHQLLGAASNRVLRSNVWYYIEGKMTISDSLGVGDMILKVNGEIWVQVDSGDSQATTNTWVDAFRFGQHISNAAIKDIDDFYILDNAGLAPFNSFLGDIRVDTIRPNGNGVTSDFVGNDADSTDNYLLVDEITPDGDTTYLKSSTAGELDMHELESLPVTPSVIYGVQPVCVCKKTDAGVRTARHVIRTGGVNYEAGADIYPSATAYIGFASLGGPGMWELNPNTGVQFIEADIDALQSGVKIQT